MLKAAIQFQWLKSSKNLLSFSLYVCLSSLTAFPLSFFDSFLSLTDELIFMHNFNYFRLFIQWMISKKRLKGRLSKNPSKLVTLSENEFKHSKNKRSPIFTYYVQFLLIIILVKFFFKWPSGYLRKKKKSLKPSNILAFLRKLAAEASCHTSKQLMSAIERFLSSMLSCFPSWAI